MCCFCWQGVMVKKANKDKDYAKEDLVLMRAQDDCYNLADKLESAWNMEKI